MSRIGKLPVTVPQGVELKVNGQEVTAKGKRGQLQLVVNSEVAVNHSDGQVSVEPRSNSRQAKTLWATTRTLINNMVVGVSDGFTKKLEINGVGYRAQVQGKELVLQLGFSHDVRYPIPEGIEIKCERPTAIEVSGHDKQKVGQVASEIRSWRPPEPFKGKGVKYEDETILRKEGKKK
ncbi:MAG: 50S ribosomal protein L6 [Pseudomonadota bacterium]